MTPLCEWMVVGAGLALIAAAVCTVGADVAAEPIEDVARAGTSAVHMQSVQIVQRPRVMQGGNLTSTTVQQPLNEQFHQEHNFKSSTSHRHAVHARSQSSFALDWRLVQDDLVHR